jgi:hypothetical protein
MATSLMNDIGFLHNVVWNLTSMAKAVFSTKSQEDKEVNEILALTEDDLDEIVEDTTP